MKLKQNEAILLLLVVVIVLFCGLLPFGLLFGLGGMMGFGMMGPGMMGGTGFFWLFLLVLLVLILAGVVWLATFRGNSRTFTPDSTSSLDEVGKCPNCSRGVLPDWKVCPYCGEPLKGEEKL